MSAIPIVDQQGVPVGIVSESDLLLKERRVELEGSHDLRHAHKRRQERAKARGTVAADLMTSPAMTVRSDTSLGEAARLMQERNVRRLVVVDERGRITGIVSRSDLLQVFLRSDEDLRDEIAHKLVPAVLLPPDDAIGIEVSWNVATLSGEVDRKSDAEILARLARELDGVVAVVDRLELPLGRHRQRAARSDLRRHLTVAIVKIDTGPRLWHRRPGWTRDDGSRRSGQLTAGSAPASARWAYVTRAGRLVSRFACGHTL